MFLRLNTEHLNNDSGFFVSKKAVAFFSSAAMSSPNSVQQLDASFIVHPGSLICPVQLKQMRLNLQTDVSLEIFITGFVLV